MLTRRTSKRHVSLETKIKNVYGPDEANWQTGNNGLRLTTQQLFIPDSSTAACLPTPLKGMERKAGTGEAKSFPVKEKIRPKPPEEPEHILVSDT